MFIIHEGVVGAIPNILQKGQDYIEFEMLLQTADSKNRNGRWYSQKVLDAALKAPYIEERLSCGGIPMEINHPSDQSIQRQTQVDISNMGGIVKRFFWSGNNLMGVIQTLPTTKGRDIMMMVKSGYKIGVSLRAQGGVHFDNQLDAQVVEPNLNIIAYDFVLNPSNYGSYITTISEESFEAFTHTQSIYKGNRQLALCESLNLADNGSMINLNEVSNILVEDFAQFYPLKRKNLKHYYNFNENDQVSSVSDDKKFMNIKSNDGTYKKVMTEDFVKKDIRDRIRKI